jgi:hypothetical protein
MESGNWTHGQAPLCPFHPIVSLDRMASIIFVLMVWQAGMKAETARTSQMIGPNDIS